jgi:homoserine kinase type II
VPLDPEFLAGVLSSWGLDDGFRLADVGRGTNNHTFLVGCGDKRFVMRINQTLSMAEVRAEHGVLRRLRRAELPFQVPEPVVALDGETVVGTEAGPASLCRWIPGECPTLDDGSALEHFGRAAGLLDVALARVPIGDVLRDWRSDPLVVPGLPDLDVLCDELRDAGISDELTALLRPAARRVARDWSTYRNALPIQVIHGDLGAGNSLIDPRTGQISAMLDFEFAGVGFRVQDLVAALLNAGALEKDFWLPRTSALIRGYTSACPLNPAETAAIPGLLLARSVGSVLWRASRWRAGMSRLDEVADRLEKLEIVSGLSAMLLECLK